MDGHDGTYQLLQGRRSPLNFFSGPFIVLSGARGWHPEGYLPLIKKNQSISPTINTTMRMANKKNMLIVHDHIVLLL